MVHSIRIRVGLFAAALLLLAVACSPAVGGVPRSALRHAESVRIVEEPFIVQDFTMPASTGRTLQFSELRGDWVLVFFGYTHCPDFCPLTLVDLVKVKELLGPQADQVEVVYISVDGLRDTPDLMRRYLDHFDSSFIGLSGDDKTLERIHTDYDLYYKRAVVKDSDTYVVDHSTRTYLIDPQGRLRLSFAYSTDPEIVAEVLGDFIAQGPGIDEVGTAAASR